jgi:excisionase family DNA binding protein
MLHQLENTGLTVAEAAVHLGITPTAVRRRIQRGTLRAWKADGTWHVDVPSDTPPVSPVNAPRDRPVHAPPGYTAGSPEDVDRDRPVSPVQAILRDELADLRGRLTETARALEREQVANAELRVLLQRALERQPMLELPAATMPTAEPFSEPAHAETPPPADRKRRWWRWIVWG